MGFKMIMISLKDHRTILLACVVLLSMIEFASTDDQNRKQVVFNLDKLCRTSPFARICRGASIAKKNIIEAMFDQPKTTRTKRKHFCREHALHPRCRGASTVKRDIVDNFDEYGLLPLENEAGIDGIDRLNINDKILNNPILLGDLLREAVERASSEYDIPEK